MGYFSAGVLGIFFWLVLVASLWIIISNIKKLMFYNGNDKKITTLSGSYYEQKRQDTRIGIVWPVTIETPEGKMSAKTKDISLGGAFIVCKNPLPLKERFRLSIEATGLGPMSLNSEVIWSNSNLPDDKVINRGMGIRFIQNTDKDRKYLEAAISNYLS